MKEVTDKLVAGHTRTPEELRDTLKGFNMLQTVVIAFVLKHGPQVFDAKYLDELENDRGASGRLAITGDGKTVVLQLEKDEERRRTQ